MKVCLNGEEVNKWILRVSWDMRPVTEPLNLTGQTFKNVFPYPEFEIIYSEIPKDTNFVFKDLPRYHLIGTFESCQHDRENQIWHFNGVHIKRER